MNERRSDDWSPTERQAFLELPSECDPLPVEEERTVARLRDLGLLPSRDRETGSERRHTSRFESPTMIVRIAAAFVLFSGGIVTGALITSSGRSVLDDEPPVHSLAGAGEAVQRAGSEFVRAIARAAELPVSASERRRAAEAALASLRAAATTIPMLSPGSSVAVHLQQALVATVHEAGFADGRESVIWF